MYAPSQNCIDKLKNLEAFRSMPYQDGGGIWTVGYGQVCLRDAYPNGVTEPQALIWLTDHVKELAGYIEELLPGLMPHQVDAVILFAYNIGIGKFKSSSALAYLKHKNWDKCFGSWRLWVHDAKGVEEPGLDTRRDFEIALFIWGWA